MSRSTLKSKETKARSNVGVAGRSRDPERLRVARRDHAAIRLELLLTETLAKVPPLTAEQTEYLVGVLRNGGAK